MKLLLAGFISVLATAAFAQPDNKPANAMDLRSAQADVQKSDGVPAGGCMPIGLTARGDLVFPMQCRELIERERGPIPEEKKQISEPRSQQEPSAKTTPAEKVTPVAVTPAEKVTPVAVAPIVAVAPVEVTPAEKGAAATGQAQERARKRLARTERRKQQGPATAAASDPQTTGSTTQATGSSLRWFSTTR
jgi:outer membrane biosynthesis protein TonB